MSAADRATKFYGWRVVAGAFVLAVFGWGIGFYAPPILLHAVREAHGWPLAMVSAAVTLHFLSGAIVVANLPRLYARFGVPDITKAGAVILALGLSGWALAAEPWQLFAAALVSGAGWVALGAAAVNAIIAPWFVRKRPTALAAAYNGASIGGVIFSPLLVALIAALGFATAAMLTGAVLIAVIWLLAGRVFSRTPEAMGQLPDGDVPEMDTAPPAPIAAPALPCGRLWRNRSFLTLACGMALGMFAQAGLLAHLFSLLVPALGTQNAGFAMGLATAAAIAGRSLVGWLMPQGTDRRLFAVASYGVQMLGGLALLTAAGTNIPLLLTGVVLFGSGIGNATSLPPLIAQNEFAKADVMRAIAQIVATSQATYAFAPMAFGLLRQTFSGQIDAAPGPAPEVFIVAIVLQGLACCALFAGRSRLLLHATAQHEHKDQRGEDGKIAPGQRRIGTP